MSRLLALRQEIRSRRRSVELAIAAASCLAIVAAIILVIRLQGRQQTLAPNLAVVSKTVNLWDAGTIRGERPGPLQSVFLPASLVKLTIILPRFSPPGQYAVAVTRDQSGNGLMARGRATAMTNSNQETVSVDLDLRQAEAGAYFLATVHEQDQASYYYPLQIR